MTLHRRTARTALTTLGVSALLVAGLPGIASAEPPNIPDAGTAQTQLGELTVQPDGSQDGYDRDKFPHWSDQGDNCNTREAVLKRDGTDVEVGTDCAATSGSWFSPYDDATWTQPSDVDIDHVVPLAAAWRTGAASWTDDKREQYANDLDAPQLIAVTDNVNQEKGDKSPDAWKPPSTGYWCTYARMWIGVKHKWELTVSDAEKTALTDMLGRC
ncbi:HNH endonuclease family protein [Amycolatopsis sp. 195334CR]|uniref:HNH endonuclease family protein n=1 Tax=Amycolatopsis sp. 195334CR TaxID=2814588 RepID=UPI001A905A3B|nr:HNH endonuclease family protein [Amycolatopsis sp. 195334CR]MBN6035841.1 HNH endonuclease [Amycolatopsis sp. 195334CR]